MKEELKKEYVSRDIALAMKDLGWNGFSFGWLCYFKSSGYEFRLASKPTSNSKKIWLDENTKDIVLPTYQQALKWFRDEHNLHAEPIWDNHAGTYWFFSITEIGNVDFTEGRHNYESPLKEDQDFNDGYPVVLKWVETYEEAQENCLIKLIEIIKNKSNT